MSKSKKDNADKKWYQKAWSGVKKVLAVPYKAITSNTGAIILAGIGLALGVVTGGAVPIALAVAVLTIKVVKTGIDTAKAIKTRDLDIENAALIDYAAALCLKQKMLDLQPKLKGNGADLAVDDSKLSKEARLKRNHSLETVGKIVEVMDIGLDLATLAVNPAKAPAVLQKLKQL
ncbi:MAG: hypothetical protein AB8B68_02165 [Rickettsiaceae bacterium]